MTDVLVALALQQIGTASPDAQLVMRIAVNLAQEANKAAGLKGRERLDLVVRALRETLAMPAIKERMPEAAWVALTEVVEVVVPETLTLVVSASRGSFQLKKPSVGCVVQVLNTVLRIVSVFVPAVRPAVAPAAAVSAALVSAAAASVDPAPAPAPSPAPSEPAVPANESTQPPSQPEAPATLTLRSL